MMRRHRTVDMILEKGPAGLEWWLPAADQIFADARLADIEAQLEQFAVNARCTPAWILTAHAADQFPDFRRDSRTPSL